MTERDFAIEVVQRLQQAGYQALWAGGCVRDELLGLVPKDYDVASNARPEEVRRLFKRTIAVGMSFGVVEIIGPRTNSHTITVQVATFRSDVSYSDGRRPDQVIYSSPEEDALRRDFTVNGMFFDPIKGELIDYVGGQQDLQDKVLRAIGDPFQRFEEDKLRLLRAVRMATRFELEIEPHTAEAVKKMAPQIIVVSAERIGQELRQFLVHPRRVRGMRLLHQLGLMKPLLPELLPLMETSETSEVFETSEVCSMETETSEVFETSEVCSTTNLWEHTLAVLDQLAPAPSFPLAFAALLHEIGQPLANIIDDPPEQHAAHMVEEIADRLRLSNAEKSLTAWLVANHRCLCRARELPFSKLKRLLVHEHIGELLKLHRVDALAKGESDDHVQYCEELLERWTAEELNPPPVLTGDDLKQMGLKPGPIFKEVLDTVRDAQLDGEISTAAEAKKIVEEMLKK